MSDGQLIAPERQGLWTVAALVIALLALVMSLVGMYRTNMILVGTQLEVVALSERINSLKQAPAPVVAEAKSAEAPKQ